MIKFIKAKGTEIRKVCTCDELGNPNKVISLIGKVSDLLEHEIIFNDNTFGNMNKWLVINNNGNEIIEFDTLEDSKNFINMYFN